MQTPALTVAQVPHSYEFVSNSQDVDALRNYFCDADTFDSFLVRVENCAILDGYGMYGVIPHNGKTVYALETVESRQRAHDTALQLARETGAAHCINQVGVRAGHFEWRKVARAEGVAAWGYERTE
jgi:hypothetical protein